MWRNKGCQLLAAALMSVTSLTAFAAVNDIAVKVPWSYKGNTGPEFWGRLDAGYLLCAEGKRQSPIDISKNDLEVANTLSMQYNAAPTSIIEDGETRLMINKDLTIYNDGHTLQVDFPQDKQANVVMYEGERYQLVQFHFHSPSENQLNGDAAPLEVHFVHQGKGGKVLVVGVLIKGGAPNTLLQSILQHLPTGLGKEHQVSREIINPKDLLPLDNDYYSFAGSLTTPPCTENVKWVVMAATVTASPAQIASIRNVIGGSNARAVQPLNGRLIAYSMEKQS